MTVGETCDLVQLMLSTQLRAWGCTDGTWILSPTYLDVSANLKFQGPLPAGRYRSGAVLETYMVDVFRGLPETIFYPSSFPFILTGSHPASNEMSQ